jgi:hypothetical protein
MMPGTLGLVFSASDLTGILGFFDRARQSRRFFNMFGGPMRLIFGLRRERLLVVFDKHWLPCHLFLRSFHTATSAAKSRHRDKAVTASALQ